MTGLWPVRLARCCECRRLFWPWQDIRSTDPESGALAHHECHHRAAQALWGPHPEFGEMEPQADWREYLWCGCDPASL